MQDCHGGYTVEAHNRETLGQYGIVQHPKAYLEICIEAQGVCVQYYVEVVVRISGKARKQMPVQSIEFAV